MGCCKGWPAGGGGGATLPEFDHVYISASDFGLPSEANYSHAQMVPDDTLTFTDYAAFKFVTSGTPDINLTLPMPQNADNSSAAALKLKMKPIFIAEDAVSGSAEQFQTRSRVVDVSQSLKTAGWGAAQAQSIAARSQYDIVMGTSGNPDAAWDISTMSPFSSDESAVIQVWIERQNTGWSSNLLFLGAYLQYATDWSRISEWST